MGANFSLRVFEFVNDVHILVGSGVFGICALFKNGMNTNTFKTLSVVSLTVASIWYVLTPVEDQESSKNKVIFITGCDSGLGYSLALHAFNLGFIVVAGCLSLNSPGAEDLSKVSSEKLKVIELDITKNDSIKKSLEFLNTYLDTHPDYVFWALINNAGVMVFGEFEWQTDKLIIDQIQVNLLGTIRVTKLFTPLLRKHSGRVISVTSHCALETLPGLSVYGGTKAAIQAWSDGIRVELAKYGVLVITFIPGSFINQSNIMARQNENVKQMKKELTMEQLEFYGSYFNQYNLYLSSLSGNRTLQKIADEELYGVYEKTLLDKYPRAQYVHEPWRYTIYHTLFKISPVKIRDKLIEWFVQMPKYDSKRKEAPVLLA